MSTTAEAPQQSHDPELERFHGRLPWVIGPENCATLSDKIAGITENPQPAWWWPTFLGSFLLMAGGVFAAVYLISTGVGVWGSNNPVGWAFDITNFVFWIGIGHAGTLISAILFLFRQKWRTSINRFSEAMTIFAVICAGVYPGIHVGRFWYAWFMFPVPNANHIWQNFRSALLWDLFAVSTYFSVSLMFWYTGLVPDMATLRDRAKGKLRQTIFGLLCFGWRGSTRHWRHYEIAYLMLAGLSTPLVLSVHSVVSFDFATSVIPGWHTTIFPPYFVAGAIFGGFAMVLQCMIPVRAVYGLEHVVTTRHLDVMAKFILATGTLVGYAYAMEFFIAWYSGVPYETQIFMDRTGFDPNGGRYWWAYWIMVSCNLFVPQVLWFKFCRTNPWALWIVSVLVGLGMWFERYVIIVQSLHRDFLPGSWGLFVPSWVDWLQMFGDFGLFFTLTLLFIRFLPMIAIAEVKGVLPNAHPHHHGHEHEHEHGSKHEGDHAKPAEAHANNGHASGNGHTNGHSNGNGNGEVPIYGPNPGSGKTHAIIAQFAGPAELMHAARTLRDAGYKTLDAYTPYPVHGMVKSIGMTRSRLPLFTLTGAFTGLATAVVLQFGITAGYYPIIVGGKQYRAWEAFVPICFELTVLLASLFTVLSLVWLCGLPKLYDPKDYHPTFDRASQDGFFLTVEANDPKFDKTETAATLKKLGGYNIGIVEE